MLALFYLGHGEEMERYNKEILEKMFNICERKGAIKNVGAEYYKKFLELSDQEMESLIGYIIIKKCNYMNSKILNNEWEDDKEIYGYVKSYLEMMALGIMGIGIENDKLCFCKPVGDSPDKRTKEELDIKIQKTNSIIDKVLRKALEEQPDIKKDKDSDVFRGRWLNRDLCIYSFGLLLLAIYFFVTGNWKFGLLNMGGAVLLVFLSYGLSGGRNNPHIYD